MVSKFCKTYSDFDSYFKFTLFTFTVSVVNTVRQLYYQYLVTLGSTCHIKGCVALFKGVSRLEFWVMLHHSRLVAGHHRRLH